MNFGIKAFHHNEHLSKQKSLLINLSLPRQKLQNYFVDLIYTFDDARSCIFLLNATEYTAVVDLPIEIRCGEMRQQIFHSVVSSNVNKAWNTCIS